MPQKDSYVNLQKSSGVISSSVQTTMPQSSRNTARARGARPQWLMPARPQTSLEQVSGGTNANLSLIDLMNLQRKRQSGMITQKGSKVRSSQQQPLI